MGVQGLPKYNLFIVVEYDRLFLSTVDRKKIIKNDSTKDWVIFEMRKKAVF